MGTISRKDNTNTMQPVKSPAVLLMNTIADTSWRMFAPTIAGIVLGLWADSAFDSKPTGLIIGVTVGFMIAGSLVLRQIRKGDK